MSVAGSLVFVVNESPVALRIYESVYVPARLGFFSNRRCEHIFVESECDQAHAGSPYDG